MTLKHYDYCPACQSDRLTRIESVPTIRIAEAWSKVSAQAGTALSHEIEAKNIPDCTQVFKCDRCQLEFANPMYSALSDWYGEVERYGVRWEFQQCLADFDTASNILEIGCGEGYFLELVTQAGYQALGLDFNTTAIQVAQARGLNAQCWDLKALKEHRSQQKFDRVAFFHVLEHIEDLDSFFADLTLLTTEGASLHFSCPNTRRYSTHLVEGNRLADRDFWDYPPHHQTRWVPSAIEKLLDRLGWKLVKVLDEPFNWIGVSSYLAALNLEKKGRSLADLSPLQRKATILAHMAQTLIPSKHYSGGSLYCMAVRA
ncbi:class I SAM-dependent methyltransferase [Pseudanabaenaceae cyanobacterium LEGE 13415]|nr:class I SAM-dependent methyltransferase [Pseudanabaenaceae cyanobacterium LEGE 13415]